VLSHRHQLQDLSKFHKIDSLLRFQRMLLEEGNDRLLQMIQAPHSICHALPVIGSNHAAPKESFERMEQLDIALVLHNCELKKHLESGSHLRVLVDADEEATFAVNESNHPLRFQSSGM
jgi:hypothetical protein